MTEREEQASKAVEQWFKQRFDKNPVGLKDLTGNCFDHVCSAFQYAVSWADKNPTKCEEPREVDHE